MRFFSLLLVGMFNIFFLLDLLYIRVFFFFFLLRYSSYFFFSMGLLLDKLSYLLFMLRLWVLFLMLIVGLKYKNFIFSFLKYKLIRILLVFFLVISFSFLNLLGFYVFFEVSLLPLIFIIMGWGYQVERLQATYYLLLYTVFGSMPFFLVLIYLNNFFLSLNWQVFFFSFLVTKVYYLLFFMVFLSFFIKLPVYLFHLWLPKAHVEAPVGGSIVLAAVLLKLGAYGAYRFFFIFISMKNFFSFAVIFTLWGSLVSRLICLRQCDMKALVAYSSISHIGVLISGFFLLGWLSIKGAIIILLAHGFCSSCLFFLVNFSYERTLTRQIVVSRGQLNYYYFVVVFWFVFLSINFGAPPFLNLFGEILILFGLVVFNFSYLLLFGTISFFVASYCLYLYSSVAHGHCYKFLVFFLEIERVFLIFIFHSFPILFFVIKMEFFSR